MLDRESISDFRPARTWIHLNHLQVGRYAEYLVKMEFTRLGFSVFSSEVDDRGIDLAVRNNIGQYFDVQVKSIRGLNYVFLPKSTFPTSERSLAAVVVFVEGDEPHLFLIPSSAWSEPSTLLVSRDYGEPRRSKPEWGLNISRRNWKLLEEFAFERIAATLRSSSLISDDHA